MSASTLYQLYGQIFEEYYVYRSDSALFYVDQAEKMAIRLNDLQKQQQCIINRSLLLATTGYFSQALEQLNEINRAQVDSTMLLSYYTAYEWVYSVWSEYSNDDVYAPQFRKKEVLYNDSMLQVLPRESNEYYYWKGELKARTGNQLEAQQAYEKALQGLAVNTRLYACVTCGLAFAHKRQGNFREYEKYLILSSISDNTCPLKENLSMQELAIFLYETSDQELEKANAEIEDQKDKYLRLSAEFDNYRKRTMKEKAELILNGGEKSISSILPIVDDFERALKNMETATDVAAVKEGVELIYNKFMTVLGQNGVKVIETKEQPLDTDYHEAIAVIPAPDEALKGKILDCVQTGYTLNDKVIRHAKVVVGE